LSSLEHLYQQTGLHWRVVGGRFSVSIEDLTISADIRWIGKIDYGFLYLENRAVVYSTSFKEIMDSIFRTYQ
jgi:hypothetical protein